MEKISKLHFLSIVIITLLFITGIFVGCNQNRKQLKLSSSIPEVDKTKEVKMLTAFFGLDNALPRRSRLLYEKAPGKDGMPIVFSHELNPNTLDASDFEVTTKNGEKFVAEAATLLPANEEFELRTVLLIGEFGNYPDNPPVSVKIIGDLTSKTDHTLKGEVIKVIPLQEGPILSYAEYFTFTEDYPYVEKGRGCDCPKNETKLIIKTVWAGGVRATNGDELGENELDDFEVTLLQGADTLKVKPFQFADLSDNDNNIDLCLKESGIPILVEVNQNVVIDPRNDKNPKTKIEIKSRW